MPPVTPGTLWFQTALCLAGVVVGVLLHLKWHPLRRQFSDAWDIMTQMPWLTLLAAALMMFAEVSGESWVRRPWTLNDILDWRATVPALAADALTEYARLCHGLLPAWPLALLLPLVVSLLAWRVIRLPYRYASRRQPGWEKGLLLACVALAWIWVGLEAIHLARPLPEWAEVLRLTSRAAFSAVTMAFCQVVLVRLVIGWEEPVNPADHRDVWLAVEHAFSRWRSVACLAGLNLLWLLWQPGLAEGSAFWRWAPVEAMLAFAAVPVAVARVPGPFLNQGAHAMQALLRAFFPQVGLILTAVFMLMLVRQASALFAAQAGVGGWQAAALLPVHALVLATVRNWVFLAGVLTLLRHGLKPSARGREDAF